MQKWVGRTWVGNGQWGRRRDENRKERIERERNFWARERAGGGGGGGGAPINSFSAAQCPKKRERKRAFLDLVSSTSLWGALFGSQYRHTGDPIRLGKKNIDDLAALFWPFCPITRREPIHICLTKHTADYSVHEGIRSWKSQLENTGAHFSCVQCKCRFSKATVGRPRLKRRKCM